MGLVAYNPPEGKDYKWHILRIGGFYISPIPPITGTRNNYWFHVFPTSIPSFRGFWIDLWWAELGRGISTFESRKLSNIVWIIEFAKCLFGTPPFQPYSSWVVATQIFLFIPDPGEMIQFDGSHIFSNGLVQPPTRKPCEQKRSPTHHQTKHHCQPVSGALNLLYHVWSVCFFSRYFGFTNPDPPRSFPRIFQDSPVQKGMLGWEVKSPKVV